MGGIRCSVALQNFFNASHDGGFLVFYIYLPSVKKAPSLKSINCTGLVYNVPT